MMLFDREDTHLYVTGPCGTGRTLQSRDICWFGGKGPSGGREDMYATYSIDKFPIDQKKSKKLLN